MFRKLVLAAGATAVIAAAALSPTTASAKSWKLTTAGTTAGAPVSASASSRRAPTVRLRDCYIVRRVVWTKYGKRIRRVRVCD